MQSTSVTYNTLLAAGAPREFRAVIAGVTYGQDRIVSAVSHAALMDKPDTVGSCVAKELNLVLRDPGTIPRMAKIQMSFRLNDGTSHSEWIPRGTFYIDTRDQDTFGILTIDAFDAMLFAEQPFTTAGSNRRTWPRTDITVVNAIAARIGVSVDPRTTEVMTSEYAIPYPGDGDHAYTCREILGFIGAMYGGNWVITDQDTLRLLQLGDIPDTGTNLLVTEQGEYILIGGYRIIV